MADAVHLTPERADRQRQSMLFHFLRLHLPEIVLSRDQFDAHLARTFALFAAKSERAVAWSDYLNGLYALDWGICMGCLEGQRSAWDWLFSMRTGRSDMLLVDALRSRAVRLYPRNEEKQETAVSEFWSHLLVPESAGSLPVLARYDGQRPLAPWLIRVFQNWHLSKLRVASPTVALPDDDLALPIPTVDNNEARWHEAFRLAAAKWLDELSDHDRLLLGLRWRYKMSQREVATQLGVHEGTISRQTDKLRDRALDEIGRHLIESGWTGDDLESLILTELGGILTDDPRLSASALARLLAVRTGKVPA